MAIQIQFNWFILVASIVLLVLSLPIGFSVILSKARIRQREDKIKLLEKQRQLEILTATAKAEEKQKIKFASALHDHTLAIVNNASTCMSQNIQSLEAQGYDLSLIKEDMKAFAMLQENIREMIHDIVPRLFTSFGLLKAIEVEIKQLNRATNTFAEFHNNTTFAGELPLSDDNQLLVFKMVKEILNNLQRHSRYEFLTVSIEEVDRNFVLLFSHDGLRISNDKIAEYINQTPGMGLKLLESKLVLLNASLDYSYDSSTAFIRLTVPLNNAKGN